MGDSVRLFSIRPDDYAQFRPTYPDSLFDWLAQQCEHTRCALDVAAGSGQATLALLPHFEMVCACDASLDQLNGLADWSGGPADMSGGPADLFGGLAAWQT